MSMRATSGIDSPRGSLLRRACRSLNRYAAMLLNVIAMNEPGMDKNQPLRFRTFVGVFKFGIRRSPFQSGYLFPIYLNSRVIHLPQRPFFSTFGCRPHTGHRSRCIT